MSPRDYFALMDKAEEEEQRIEERVRFLAWIVWKVQPGSKAPRYEKAFGGSNLKKKKKRDNPTWESQKRWAEMMNAAMGGRDKRRERSG